MHSEYTSSKTRMPRIKTLCVLLAAALAWLVFRDVLLKLAGLIFGAAVLAFLISPLCILYEKKLKRGTAALLSLCTLIFLAVSALTLLTPALIRQLQTLLNQLPEAFARMQATADALAARQKEHMPGLTLPNFAFSGLQGNIIDAARSAAATVGSAAGTLYRLFLTLVLSCFLLADRENILLRVELAVPGAWRKSTVRAGNMLMRELRMYLRGQAVIALSIGIIAATGLLLLGLDSALLLGLFVGIFNAIPYFGPFLGGIPAVLAALSLSWQKAAMTVLLLFAVQQLDGTLISPRVMGSITGFSPAVVMLAIFAGAHTGGVGGMLLAVPTLMAGRTLYRVFVQRSENN